MVLNWRLTLKKRRYDVRGIPDTVVRLIGKLTQTLSTNEGRKLNTSTVIARAVAQFAGYKSCPDCDGLIEAEIFTAPPPNTPENNKLWKEIAKQHMANCSWLRMAKNNPQLLAPKVLADIEDKTEHQARQSFTMPTKKDDKLEIPRPKADIISVPKEDSLPANVELIEIEKPLEADATPQKVVEIRDGVKVVVTKKTASIDETEKFTGIDESGQGSTISQGLVPEGFKGTQNIEVTDRMGDRKSQGGKGAIKSSDNTLIKHLHNPGDPASTRLGKARVEKNIKEHKGLSLDDIPLVE